MKNLLVNRNIFLRDTDLSDYAELFVVNAVLSIVVIRVYLTLTGFPQLGGNGLHIAHMLWGGLGLAVALGLATFYIDRSTKMIAAIVGGISFGFFIDEIGKFVTSDNNYFFEPAFALMYLVFVIFFLLIRQVSKTITFSKQEEHAHLFQLMHAASIKGLTTQEKKRVNNILKYVDLPKTLTKEIHNFIRSANQVDHADWTDRVEYQLQTITQKIITFKWFSPIIKGVFIFKLLREIIVMLLVTAGIVVTSTYDFYILIYTATILIELLLISKAFIVMRKNKLRGLEGLKMSILWSILTITFYNFYFNQLSALSGLLFDIMLFYLLSTFIQSQSQKSLK